MISSSPGFECHAVYADGFAALQGIPAHRPDVVQTYLQVLHHCDMRTLARIQNPQRPRTFFATLGRGIRDATAYRRLLVSGTNSIGRDGTSVTGIRAFAMIFRACRT